MLINALNYVINHFQKTHNKNKENQLKNDIKIYKQKYDANPLVPLDTSLHYRRLTSWIYKTNKDEPSYSSSHIDLNYRNKYVETIKNCVDNFEDDYNNNLYINYNQTDPIINDDYFNQNKDKSHILLYKKNNWNDYQECITSINLHMDAMYGIKNDLDKDVIMCLFDKRNSTLFYSVIIQSKQIEYLYDSLILSHISCFFNDSRDYSVYFFDKDTREFIEEPLFTIYGLKFNKYNQDGKNMIIHGVLTPSSQLQNIPTINMSVRREEVYQIDLIFKDIPNLNIVGYNKYNKFKEYFDKIPPKYHINFNGFNYIIHCPSKYANEEEFNNWASIFKCIKGPIQKNIDVQRMYLDVRASYENIQVCTKILPEQINDNVENE